MTLAIVSKRYEKIVGEFYIVALFFTQETRKYVEFLEECTIRNPHSIFDTYGNTQIFYGSLKTLRNQLIALNDNYLNKIDRVLLITDDNRLFTVQDLSIDVFAEIKTYNGERIAWRNQ